MLNWHRVFAPTLIAIGANLLAGCESLVGLAKVEQPARIVFYDHMSEITAPDSITRGTAFDVRFNSFEATCTDHARIDVQQRADSVLIRPFVRIARGCGGDALRIFAHAVSVRIDRPGTARIYVLGRKEQPGINEDIALTRPIVVR